MPSILKKCKIPLIFSVALFLIIVGEKRSEGFRTEKIVFSLDYDASFEINSVADSDLLNVKKILNQNFFYLGRGRQFFVFVSEDGNFVLKFLNHFNFSYPSLLKKISFFKPIDKIIKRKDSKYPLTFSSLKLAFEKLKDESGLVYINLNKGQKLKQKVHLINKSGVSLSIDLDSTFFVLQKKGSSFFSYFKKVAEKENKEELRRAIDSYLLLVMNRCQKNVADDDFNLRDNIGFYGDRPFIMDMGRLYLDRDLSKKDHLLKEIQRSTKILRRWLIENHPEEVFFLDTRIKVIFLHL
jgi:hypothetical protein